MDVIKKVNKRLLLNESMPFLSFLLGIIIINIMIIIDDDLPNIVPLTILWGFWVVYGITFIIEISIYVSYTRRLKYDGEDIECTGLLRLSHYCTLFLYCIRLY